MTTQFTTPTPTQIVATRTFDAPRDVIWQCFASPEHVPQWMLGPDGWTMPVCEIDLRPGGQWHYVWQKGAGGERMEMTGEFREVAAPDRLVNTEAWGGDWAETLNTLVLTEENGKTKTVCTVLYPDQAARDRATATGMKDGWSQSYDRLDHYLTTI